MVCRRSGCGLPSGRSVYVYPFPYTHRGFSLLFCIFRPLRVSFYTEEARPACHCSFFFGFWLAANRPPSSAPRCMLCMHACLRSCVSSEIIPGPFLLPQPSCGAGPHSGRVRLGVSDDGERARPQTVRWRGLQTPLLLERRKTALISAGVLGPPGAGGSGGVPHGAGGVPSCLSSLVYIAHAQPQYGWGGALLYS